MLIVSGSQYPAASSTLREHLHRRQSRGFLAAAPGRVTTTGRRSSSSAALRSLHQQNGFMPSATAPEALKASSSW